MLLGVSPYIKLLKNPLPFRHGECQSPLCIYPVAGGQIVAIYTIMMGLIKE